MNEMNTEKVRELLETMFNEEAEYGSGFYNHKPWLDAYEALAREIGIDLDELMEKAEQKERA